MNKSLTAIIGTTIGLAGTAQAQETQKILIPSFPSILPTQTIPAPDYNGPFIFRADNTSEGITNPFATDPDTTSSIINRPYTVEVQEKIADYISRNNHKILMQMSQDSTAQSLAACDPHTINLTKPEGLSEIPSLHVNYQGLDEKVLARTPTSESDDLFRSHAGTPLQGSILLKRSGELHKVPNGTSLYIQTPDNVTISNAEEIKINDKRFYEIRVDDVSHHWIRKFDCGGVQVGSNPLYIIGEDNNLEEMVKLEEQNEQLQDFLKTKDLTISILSEENQRFYNIINGTENSNAGTNSSAGTGNISDGEIRADSPNQTELAASSKKEPQFYLSVMAGPLNLDGQIEQEYAHSTAVIPVARKGSEISAKARWIDDKNEAIIQVDYSIGDQVDSYEEYNAPDVESTFNRVEGFGQFAHKVWKGLTLGAQAAGYIEDTDPINGDRFGTTRTTVYGGPTIGFRNTELSDEFYDGVDELSISVNGGLIFGSHNRTHNKSGGAVRDFGGLGFAANANMNIPINDRLSASLNMDGAILKMGGEEYDLTEKLMEGQVALEYALSDKVSFFGGVNYDSHGQKSQIADHSKNGFNPFIGIKGRW